MAEHDTRMFLASAINSAREEQSRRFDEIGQKVDALTEKVDSSQVKLGRHSERLKAVESSAGEAHGPGKAGWAGIIIAGLTAMGSALAAFFTGKHSQP